MNMARKLFSEKDLQAIESAVRAAEAGTSGEIVPVVVDAASSYDWLAYRTAIIGLVAGSGVAAGLHFFHPFVFSYWMTFAFQALGLVSGWVLARLPWGIRALLHERLMAAEVLEAAQRSFLRHGLAETRDRTGVLVFVSLLERRVQILGDRGIHEKVGDAYWREMVEQVASSLRAGRPGEGLVAVIQEVGSTLRTHFPSRPDDRNELANGLQFD